MVISVIGFQGIDRPLGINRHAASTGLVAMNSFVASVDLTASTIDYRLFSYHMEYHHISWGGNIIHFLRFFYMLPCSFTTPPHYPKINLVYTYNTNSKSEERDNWLDLLSLQYSGNIFIIIPLLYNKKKLLRIQLNMYIFLLVVPLN